MASDSVPAPVLRVVGPRRHVTWVVPGVVLSDAAVAAVVVMATVILILRFGAATRAATGAATARCGQVGVRVARPARLRREVPGRVGLGLAAVDDHVGDNVGVCAF